MANEELSPYKRELLEKLAVAKKDYQEQLEQIHKQIKELSRRMR